MTIQNAAADNTTPSVPATGAQGGDDTAPAGADGSQAADKGTEGGKPRSRGIQRRIDKLTEEKYQYKAEAEYYKRLAEGKAGEGGSKPAASAADPDAEPNPDDFTDPKEFTKAIAKWTARQELKSHSKNEARNKEAASSEEQAEAFAAREDEYREVSDGYDDAVDNLRDARVRFSPTAIDFIQDIEAGPALLEKLGNDLKEAKRIAALSPARQVAELTRLADKLPAAAAKPEEKKRSGAPDPVSPVRNRASVEKGRDELTDDEWAKRRMAEKKAKK
jgi:hypothetical protein